jgi:hypothetical protein
MPVFTLALTQTFDFRRTVETALVALASHKRQDAEQRILTQGSRFNVHGSRFTVHGSNPEP